MDIVATRTHELLSLGLAIINPNHWVGYSKIYAYALGRKKPTTELKRSMCDRKLNVCWQVSFSPKNYINSCYFKILNKKSLTVILLFFTDGRQYLSMSYLDATQFGIKKKL